MSVLTNAQAHERVRVVGILDGWQKRGDCWTVGAYSSGGFFCSLQGSITESTSFDGATPDEARAKAAAAIEAGGV